ncbi:hypothetical protein QQ045_028651 [Rhodiola kirilowii]
MSSRRANMSITMSIKRYWPGKAPEWADDVEEAGADIRMATYVVALDPKDGIENRPDDKDQTETVLLPVEEESESETDSSDEEEMTAMVKQFFVPKSDRDTIAEPNNIVAEAKEYEAWKAREIDRIKRNRDAILLKEREQIDKLRKIKEWDRSNPKPKKKLRFMQKYFDKGVFFQDKL